MDGGRDALIPGLLILSLFVLAIVAILIYRKLVGKRVKGYLAIAEYWIYGTTDALPPTEKLMDRMISTNPHNRKGRPSIGAREGMLFTDIRLHMGLGLRSKNPATFRPDLLDEAVVPTPEILTRLSQCQSVITVRYASEAILKDLRHLQFLPHYADAVGELTKGSVVLDRISQEIWTAEDFSARLAANNNAERPDFHIRLDWVRNEEGNRIVTRGLRKLGRREWRTELLPEDYEVLATALMIRATSSLMRDAEPSFPISIEEYGDTFLIEPAEVEDGFTSVKIYRQLSNVN